VTAFAAASGLLGLCLTAGAALAIPLTTTPTIVLLSGAVSATDNQAAGSTSNNGAAFPSVNAGKYDGSDILTGVVIDLTSTLTPGGAGGGGPQTGNRTATGTGQISVPGASQTFGPATASGSCSKTGMQGNVGCTYTATGAAQAANTTFNITSGLLDYFGPGTFTVTRSAPSLSATSGGTFSGMTPHSFTFNESWTGSLSTTYQYLKHANGSFDGVGDQDVFLIDFGTLFQGDAAQLGFIIYNLADAAGAGATAGLDFDSILGSGDTGKLTTDLALFSNLAAGGSQSFAAFLDTAALGSFGASYVLTLSDQNVGVGGKTSSLRVNLAGTVVARPVVAEAVAEPGTLALLGVGLTSIGLAARRRRGRTRA
jgi:hypothetical protein